MEEKEIGNMLKDLGIFPNYKGYKYLTQLVKLALNGEIESGVLTKFGYPLLAKRYQVTPGSVERACRSVISSTYDRYPESYFTKLRIKTRPTNSEFVFTLADTMRETKKEEA